MLTLGIICVFLMRGGYLWEKNNSLWDLFQQKNLSRRSFLKTCVTVTGILGLSPMMLSEVVSAAENKTLVPLIWLHGHECTGCDETFIRSQTPLSIRCNFEYDFLRVYGCSGRSCW